MFNFFIHAIDYALKIYLKLFGYITLISLVYFFLNYRKWKKILTFNVFLFYILNVIVISLWKLPSSNFCLGTSIFYRHTFSNIHLVPFNFFHDIYYTYLNTNSMLIASKFIWFTLLNVVYFIPFGYYLKSLFNFEFKWIVFFGFLFSFFIEFMQISGIFGIYNCSWRYFDIDDILTNTIGTIIGVKIYNNYRGRK